MTYFRPVSMVWRLVCSRTRTFSPARLNKGSRKRKWIGDICGARISYPASRISSVKTARASMCPALTCSDSSRAATDAGSSCTAVSIVPEAMVPRSATAASRERRRIFAAPRFDTSSILRTVCTSPRPSRISWTWSAVIASTPQPKELSWTISRSGSSPTRAAASYRREW